MRKIKLSIPQIHSITVRSPLTLCMAGQRAGKSYGIGFRSANYVRYFPKLVGMIAANTYLQLTQSTMVAVRKTWKEDFGITEFDKDNNPNGVYVVNKIPPAHFVRFQDFDEYRGIISFRNGAVIFMASLENYLVHDGKTLAWAELDETKDTKKQAVKQVILARLSQAGLYYDEQGTMHYTEEMPKPGWTPYNPCFINTSPAEGTVDWLEEMFNLNKEGRDEEILKKIEKPDDYYFLQEDGKAIIIYSTYWNAANLPANYIENRKSVLTDGEFTKLILGHPFSKTGGEWFHKFERRKHLKPCAFDPSLPVHLGYDFNLRPYMTLVCMQVHDSYDEMVFRFFNEFCYAEPNNTTIAVTEAFIEEYGHQTTDVFYYGDAQGTKGIEGFGSSVTRFDDARNTLHSFVTYDSDRTTRINPGVNKRRNLINRILDDKFSLGHKKVRIEIDPKCTEIIRDMQYLKAGTNGKLKEKAKDEATGAEYEKFGHTSDALEYIISYILEDYL